MINKLKLILENENDKPIKIGQNKKPRKLSLTSADDQIDGILLNLKLGAVQGLKDDDLLSIKKEESDEEEGAEEATLSESLRNFNLKALLKEEDEPGVATSSDIDIDEPAVPESVAINVSSFAKHVKEFVDTANDQLDIASVIVNRARNLIKDKHPDAVDAFERELKDLNLMGNPRFENKPDESFQVGSIGGGG